MAEGRGRYGHESEATLVRTGGYLVAVLVAGGIHGSGFGVSVVDVDLVKLLPGLLRTMADQIEADSL